MGALLGIYHGIPLFGMILFHSPQMVGQMKDIVWWTVFCVMRADQAENLWQVILVEVLFLGVRSPYPLYGKGQLTTSKQEFCNFNSSVSSTESVSESMMNP